MKKIAFSDIKEATRGIRTHLYVCFPPSGALTPSARTPFPSAHFPTLCARRQAVFLMSRSSIALTSSLRTPPSLRTDRFTQTTEATPPTPRACFRRFTPSTTRFLAERDTQTSKKEQMQKAFSLCFCSFCFYFYPLMSDAERITRKAGSGGRSRQRRQRWLPCRSQSCGWYA